MTSRVITTTCKNTDYVANELAHSFNAEGYMTMIEAIPGGRKVKITKSGVFRTVTGMATCVDVDITTTDGGLLVSYNPSLFKQNAVATTLSMLVFWPILVTQIIGWINRSGLDETIYSRVEAACAREVNHRAITD